MDRESLIEPKKASGNVMCSQLPTSLAEMKPELENLKKQAEDPCWLLLLSRRLVYVQLVMFMELRLISGDVGCQKLLHCTNAAGACGY
jgi:hypothetical protein